MPYNIIAMVMILEAVANPGRGTVVGGYDMVVLRVEMTTH
jgi:hypothetical protein